jgi:hypothetical protein
LSCCSAGGAGRWPRRGRRARSRSACGWWPGTGAGIDAAVTPADTAAFGGVQGGGPQLRLLALIECGTHALIDAVFDGVARAGEQKLARRLLRAPGPGMLLLSGRDFPGRELRRLAAGTGAGLAWRIKKNLVVTPLRALPDGSFLSGHAPPRPKLSAWAAHRRRRTEVRSATKNQLLSQLDRAFPGITRALPDVLGTKAGRLVAAHFADPARLARLVAAARAAIPTPEAPIARQVLAAYAAAYGPSARWASAAKSTGQPGSPR